MTPLEIVIESLREARELAVRLEQEVVIYLIDMALLEATEAVAVHPRCLETVA